jgi:serine phosphatase RsbU (regulator of sigma subunit)
MARLISDLQYHCLLYPEPGQLLSQINTLLSARTHRGMFVTLIYMVLDTQTRRIAMANAGHPGPLSLSGDKQPGFWKMKQPKALHWGLYPASNMSRNSAS